MNPPRQVVGEGNVSVYDARAAARPDAERGQRQAASGPPFSGSKQK
jgi:hypothetical protein